jgi:hypothetical protein
MSARSDYYEAHHDARYQARQVTLGVAAISAGRARVIVSWGNGKMWAHVGINWEAEGRDQEADCRNAENAELHRRINDAGDLRRQAMRFARPAVRLEYLASARRRVAVARGIRQRLICLA